MTFSPAARRFWAVGLFSLAALSGGCLGLYATPMTKVEIALQAPIQAIDRFFVPAPADLFGKSQLRILIVGLDYDYNALDEEISKSSRSDIIMALNLNLRTPQINELSVPRDMVAVLPNGRQGKINQAQSDGGIRESQAVVAKWLGIRPFDRYVVLRIDTAKDLINAIGGIDLNVQNSSALRNQGKNGPLDYDDNWGHLHVHLVPGVQHLNGERAIGYARFRHDWCSDPCRILRQQQVLRAIVTKIEHDQLNTLTHIQPLIGVFRHDVDTDLTPQEELSLAVAFAHINPHDVKTAQIPYVDTVMLPDYGDSLVPDERAKGQLVATMFPDPQGVPARPIRVCIENGTGVPGLAAKIGVKLRAKGFAISELRDAPRSDFSVTEIYGESNAGASVRVKEALGQSASTASIVSAGFPRDTAAVSSDVTVVLGRDIIGGPVALPG
jgi:LCP family protein required for cell wall assembly